MFKKYNNKLYKAIILMVILILPVNGFAQINNKTSNRLSIKGLGKKNNKASTKTPNIKTATNQKQTKNKIKSNKQLSKPTDFSIKIKELEKKLLVKDSELSEIKKSLSEKDSEINNLNEDISYLMDTLDDLDAELYIQTDTSKKYKELIKCYRTALFNWHDMNSRKGLTEEDHWTIKVELRRSLFSCPPF